MDVVNNRAEHRFELAIDAGPAVAEYELVGDVITFTHTIVPREAEGQGVGSRLIAGALEQVRTSGLKVVPQCSFVAAYLKRHPDAADLLA